MELLFEEFGCRLGVEPKRERVISFETPNSSIVCGARELVNLFGLQKAPQIVVAEIIICPEIYLIRQAPLYQFLIKPVSPLRY
jgi:hypothetical protein